jgi:hypothetical protein
MCQFLLRNLPSTQGKLTFEPHPYNVPPYWSARVEKGPRVYFLPTQEDGSFLEQSGEKLVNKVWIGQKIQATGAKYGIAARWLKACLKHEKCRSGSSQFKTPTRLIDVGLGVQYCTNRMPRLVVGVDRTVPYVALSYRWGGPQPLILTLEASCSRANDSGRHIQCPKRYANSVLARTAPPIADSCCFDCERGIETCFAFPQLECSKEIAFHHCWGLLKHVPNAEGYSAYKRVGNGCSSNPIWPDLHVSTVQLV